MEKNEKYLNKKEKQELIRLTKEIIKIPSSARDGNEILDSGINISVRYNTIATKRNQISTDIRREIHRSIINSDNVEFAYPHTEVLFREKSI